MKICSKCNAQFADDVIFCTVCGNRITPAAQEGETELKKQAETSESARSQQPFIPAAGADNRKTYSIMAYISILWLFGLFCSPEKFDNRVRFNVGQGIIATVVCSACSFLATVFTLINNAVFKTEVSYFGYSAGSTTSGVGIFLNVLLWLAVSGQLLAQW